MRMIRTQSPKTAAGFAAWGFTFSTFDCTLIRLRRKIEFIYGTLT